MNEANIMIGIMICFVIILVAILVIRPYIYPDAPSTESVTENSKDASPAREAPIPSREAPSVPVDETAPPKSSVIDDAVPVNFDASDTSNSSEDNMPSIQSDTTEDSAPDSAPSTIEEQSNQE